MSAGAGKYDAECTAARESAAAEAVVLIVVRGNRGSGFSVQSPPGFTDALPCILRDMADQIERQESKPDAPDT